MYKKRQDNTSLITFLGIRYCGLMMSLFPLVLFSQINLYNSFKNPSSEAKPRNFWFWVNGAVSKEGVKADLIAMKEIGLEGPVLFTIREPENKNFDKPLYQLSPEWFEMLRYTMQICDSLGLKFSMHISDGFALAGGPWILPEESMQKIVFTDTIVKGGKIKNLQLHQPETVAGFYKDIEVYAIPLTFPFHRKSQKQEVLITSDNQSDSLPFSVRGKEFRSETPCYLQYQYSKPFTLRSIVITSSGNNIQSQRLKVMASNDGVNFEMVKQLLPPRQGWQNFNFTTTYAVKQVKAKYFRFVWTPEGTEPGSEDLDAAKWKPILKIKNIVLSEISKIDNWEAKSGIIWRIAPKAASNEIAEHDYIPVDKIIRLQSFFKDGKLNCKLPKGNWQIIRMGHTSTGYTNATGGPGKGLECDKFSEKAVQKQFDNWIGAVINKTDPELAKRVMKEIQIDSWECGSQNWSTNFNTEFQRRRGYDLMPFLPLLAGIPIESAEESEKVLHDVRLTISDLVTDVFFRVMVENAHKLGMELMSESVAPTFVNDGMQQFKIADRPMGEFWFRSPTHDKPTDILDAISGAHIYGKNIIQAEGFTQLRTNWDEHPALLKPMLDRQFALGINKLFFHVFVQNPSIDKSPGTTLSGMGLFFQRNQTWWKQGKAFVDYISRCQTLLQYGKPVVDIAVFTGEEIPRRALTPDRLVPYLPGIIGNKRVAEEKKRLANVGQPMMEMPYGVNYAANTFKMENWVNPLNGYAYDSFNKDVLFSAKTDNGKLKLESGMEYQVLIFPDLKNYSEETMAKIQELRKTGVLIPDLPFLEDNFNRYKLEQDVIAPENIAWTHRSGEDADVYFISNQEETEREVEISFRISGRFPELWQAVDGTISKPKDVTFQDGRTLVTLKLYPYESVFVVFPLKSNKEDNVVDEQNKPIKSLDLNWTITFERNNQKLVTSELKSWSENENPLIKYYSGTAFYKTNFTQNDISGKYLLNLGVVHNLATVRVNGIDCGTVWTAPYQVDISKALKKGMNTLEIEVTNTWANAIKGWDKGTPPFEGIWTDGQYRMKGEKLLTAGLLGSISIIHR